MHYLLTGGTGFIGSALAAALVADQHQVTILSRGVSAPVSGCTLVTLPMPAPVMRLMLGEVADELLLNGQRVLPARLQEEGFDFVFERLDQALADLL